MDCLEGQEWKEEGGFEVRVCCSHAAYGRRGGCRLRRTARFDGVAIIG